MNSFNPPRDAANAGRQEPRQSVLLEVNHLRPDRVSLPRHARSASLSITVPSLMHKLADMVLVIGRILGCTRQPRPVSRQRCLSRPKSLLFRTFYVHLDVIHALQLQLSHHLIQSGQRQIQLPDYLRFFRAVLHHKTIKDRILIKPNLRDVILFPKPLGIDDQSAITKREPFSWPTNSLGHPPPSQGLKVGSLAPLASEAISNRY